MADRQTTRRAAGFSLVEMMVALVFVGLLMAGMATVFKASLSLFHTAGENASSLRRNRMAIDLFGEDLDTACMYLANLSDPPAVDPNHPPFYILPNMPIQDDPNNLTADQVFFQVDQPLAFEGTLRVGGGAKDAATVINGGGALTADNGDNTFIVDCKSSSYVDQVVQGQTLIFKDTFESGTIASVTPVGDLEVRVVLGSAPLAAVTGLGSTGLPMKTGHINSSNVLFVQTSQVVRYQLQYLNLDPKAAVPCLVRDQGTFVGGVFTPSVPQQIITENVPNFKVYLSVDAGRNWAGWADPPKTYQDLTFGWTAGILAELNAQLTAVVTNGFTSVAGNANWFRSIPTAVRLDITTRSATKRTEYSSTPDTSAYKSITQSLIFMPRHSGLPMN